MTTWTKMKTKTQNLGRLRVTSRTPTIKQKRWFFSCSSIVRLFFLQDPRSLCRCHFLDRLVESIRMKRALESVYTGILPKGSSPFVYLRLFSIHSSWSPCWRPFSLQIDPRSVDVNVHPTKREVHFLNEEAITERIANAMQEQLAKQNHSRTFEYQVLDMEMFECKCKLTIGRKDSPHRRHCGKWFKLNQKTHEEGKR